jgi:hypothetical protein
MWCLDTAVTFHFQATNQNIVLDAILSDSCAETLSHSDVLVFFLVIRAAAVRRVAALLSDEMETSLGPK